MAKDELKAFITAHNLALDVEFVPFSKSRNAKPNAKLTDLCLNWRVTLKQADRAIVTTDYGAGIAHCPSYKALKVSYGRVTVEQDEAIRFECEHGRKWRRFATSDDHSSIKPEFCDVLASLALDCGVLDYASYEEWARDLGYDEDSRKGERVYRQCLDIALKLRNSLGPEAYQALQEAARDY